jgi:3-isopropylmalate/(R)-2-methylmalate dehydratase small subunit
VLPQETVEQIWAAIEADPATKVTVDLDAREVRVEDLVAPFEIDDYTRWRLMEGLDDIGLTLRNVETIDEFETTRPSFKPATL